MGFLDAEIGGACEISTLDDEVYIICHERWAYNTVKKYLSFEQNVNDSLQFHEYEGWEFAIKPPMTADDLEDKIASTLGIY